MVEFYYLCPATRGLWSITKELVRKNKSSSMGIDGPNDGQHMNGVPACYHPAHHINVPRIGEVLRDFSVKFRCHAQRAKPRVRWWMVLPAALLILSLPCPFQPVRCFDPQVLSRVRSTAKQSKAVMGSRCSTSGSRRAEQTIRRFASTLGIGWW